MTGGFLPARLPVSCLTMAPKYDQHKNLNLGSLRGPLTEINKEGGSKVLLEDIMTITRITIKTEEIETGIAYKEITF